MMTYFDAAKAIVEMYNELAYLAAEYDENCPNYSEAVVIAVEALMIKADREKMESIQREAVTKMTGTSVPETSIDDWMKEFKI